MESSKNDKNKRSTKKSKNICLFFALSNWIILRKVNYLFVDKKSKIATITIR